MGTKKCVTCKKELPKTIEFFATRTDRKTLYYQSNCRDCQREYRKIHYEKNKKKYIDKAVTYKRKVSDWFKEFKKELSCKGCGDDRHWVLDFHHKDPNEKENMVSTLVNKGSKIKLLEEIEKCDILCANCHRDFHYKEKYADNA